MNNGVSLNEMAQMDPRMVQRVIDADPVMKAKTDDLMQRSWAVTNKVMTDHKDEPDILLYIIANMMHVLMGSITQTMNPEEIADKFPNLKEQQKDLLGNYEGLNLGEAIYLVYAQMGFVSSYALMADVVAAKEAVSGVNADSNGEV